MRSLLKQIVEHNTLLTLCFVANTVIYIYRHISLCMCKKSMHACMHADMFYAVVEEEIHFYKLMINGYKTINLGNM